MFSKLLHRNFGAAILSENQTTTPLEDMHILQLASKQGVLNILVQVLISIVHSVLLY
jgi:hypothetical protein